VQLETHPTSSTEKMAQLPAVARWFFTLIAWLLRTKVRLFAPPSRRLKAGQADAPNLAMLRETDDRYRWLATSGRDMLLEMAADGAYTYLSPNVVSVIGYEPDDLIGKSVFESLYPDDVVPAMAAFYDALVSGRCAEIHVRFKCKSGEYRWVEGYGQSYRKSALDVRVIAVARDSTDRRRAEDAARLSQERLTLHVEHTPVAVIGWDAQGRLAEWNPAAASIFGYTRAEALSLESAMLLPAEAREHGAHTLGRWSGDLKSRRTTLTNLTKDDRKIICEWHDTPLAGSDGSAIGVTSIVQDVTERVRAQEALRDSEAAIRSLYEVTSAPHIDFHEKLRAVIAMGCSFFRLPSGVIGRIVGQDLEIIAAQHVSQPLEDRMHRGELLPLSSMYSGDVARRGEAIAIACASSEGWTTHPTYVEFRVESFIGTPVRVGGEIYGVISFGSPEPRASAFTETEKDFLRLIAQWVGLAIERDNVEAELRHNSLHDALTGLPNQRLLLDRMQMAIAQSIRTGNPIAACFLDLDRFKVVNDTLGHRVGDGLLKAVTQRLAGSLRESDTLARLGGDEFIILLPQVENAAAAGRIAQRLLDELKQPVIVDEEEVYVTASIGVSVYPEDGFDAETLIKNADHAMYRAKELGRDGYQMYSASGGHKRERLTLETSLRRAIKNDELFLEYQPQIDIPSGKIVAIEALVRWNHPERGLTPPGDFIPLAEETGLIMPIGAWVMEQACRQIATWKRIGFPPLRVAVNVSARQFRQRDFVETVEGVVRRLSLDPALLEIEMTESVTMEAGEAELETLHRLKRIGVRLAMDDFGTGYASLSNLKRFPIDVVKIDRSFVHDCLISTDDAAIVKAVVSMGQALRMHVIAEGVETKEQLAFLQLLGCDGAQGYLIGRPMSAEDIERLLAERMGILVRARPTEPAA
jgi:diguanylate cyclase (GGDEF)-like protein/PAS domain S-box-containing protein